MLYVVLFTWFVCDYLVFEHVHLYTYDFVAERVGFKLVWGCLCWYPLYYVALLVPPERADDRRCAQKYGRLWRQYRNEVPWRIVPRIY